MLKQLLNQKWYIAFILLLIILDPSLNSILNFWLQSLFNSATVGTDKLVLLRMLTMGFLLWILKRLVSFTSGVLKNRFICNAKQEVKHQLFASLLKMDTANISEIASSGEYISLFTNDIALLETRFYNQIVGLISSIFSIAILGGSLFALNMKLATAILAFGVFSMCVPVAFSEKLNEKSLAYSNAISRFTQRMKEYMVAYPTIKNYAIEAEISQKFNSINHDVEEAKFESDYAMTLANNVGQLLSWFMQFIGVGLGLMLVVNGEILVGTVVAARSFASDLASPLQDIIININSIRSVKAIVRKIEFLSTVPAEKKSGTQRATVLFPRPDQCDISFENFSLQIGNKSLINHFSFSFETGKKYLVLGLNGSGKSTLFKALKKWYSSTGGNICINGINVSELDCATISRSISYLNENVSLFSGTIKENITLFRKPNANQFGEAITNAKVQIDIDRIVSDEGRNISSGEQRRIEIARSLLRSVKVLIFDEVVSTLDIETAYEIEKMALGFADKTVIFVSHNFSGKLIREYDEILVMDNGQLLAHGSYDELIGSCDYFRRICEIRFG
ncbi:MAG: ABC transporter ATP-binding protein/permease [Lachnospiraceae bacterium]|nr:ABC transporter ATP-binding protein/permease [Lachnospiraceae bacterium]